MSAPRLRLRLDLGRIRGKGDEFRRTPSRLVETVRVNPATQVQVDNVSQADGATLRGGFLLRDVLLEIASRLEGRAKAALMAEIADISPQLARKRRGLPRRERRVEHAVSRGEQMVARSIAGHDLFPPRRTPRRISSRSVLGAGPVAVERSAQDPKPTRTNGATSYSHARLCNQLDAAFSAPTCLR